MMPIAFALLGVSTAWIIAGLVSVLRATRYARAVERPSRVPVELCRCGGAPIGSATGHSRNALALGQGEC